MSSRAPALQVVSMLSKKTRRRITQRLQSIRTRALLRISGDDCSTEETDGSTRDRRSNCHRQAGDEPCLRDPWRNDVAAIQVEWRDNRASRTSTSSDRRWRYCRPIGWRWPTRLRRSGSMAGDAPATTASSRKRTDLLFIELGRELTEERERIKRGQCANWTNHAVLRLWSGSAYLTVRTASDRSFRGV